METIFTSLIKLKKIRVGGNKGISAGNQIPSCELPIFVENPVTVPRIQTVVEQQFSNLMVLHKQWNLHSGDTLRTRTSVP